MFDFQSMFVNLSEKLVDTKVLSSGEEVEVYVLSVFSDHYGIVNRCGGFIATRNERDERLILVTDQAKNHLTGEELEAVLAHEVAHHELGHVPSFSAAETGQVIQNQGIEIEADAFAVSLTSKRALKTALGKCFCMTTGIRSHRAAMVVMWLTQPRRMFHLL